MSNTLSAAWNSWDRIVSNTTFSILDSIGWHVHPISDLTRGLPAVQSPTPLITSLIFYATVVTLGRAQLVRQPRTNRDPQLLKTFMVVHNVFLITLSAYMCFGCISEARKHNYSVWGNKYNPGESRLARYIYIFYISKIYEFVDTFIMLVKGNVKQVSFLHVYHHATISFIWWMITRVAPGGDAYFSAALNSWVHVCMYSYYLLAIVIGKDSERRKTYLWWGRYLTQMQMFQFMLNLCQALYCSKFSEYPRFLSNILLVYMGTLLALFGHFYYSKHIATSRRAHEKQM